MDDELPGTKQAVGVELSAAALRCESEIQSSTENKKLSAFPRFLWVWLLIGIWKYPATFT